MKNLLCGMVLWTKAPTSDVTSWLQSTCTGQWDLHPTGIGTDGETKKFVILFEDELDHRKFEGRYGRLFCAA